MTHTLLYIGAHPDDEGSAGGCLAKYAAQGARVFVACATRGDSPDAQIKNNAATRETLAEARSQELIAACAALGISPPFFLGHQDGRVDQADGNEAAQAVARLIREVRADVVITHGPEGGYGHPDHIAVSAFVTRAFELTRAETPAPAKLYYTAIPRSFLERVPAFQTRRADIRGEQLRFVGVPDELITTTVDIHAWMTTKVAALACHRTQFELDEHGRPKTFASSVPEDQREALFGYERFVRAFPAPPRGEMESDLLAGVL
jgi:LmbE family N-acetylglucosaminyl deacetylase